MSSYDFSLIWSLGPQRLLHWKEFIMERGYNESPYTPKFEKLANETQGQRSHQLLIE